MEAAIIIGTLVFCVFGFRKLWKTCGDIDDSLNGIKDFTKDE